MCKIQIYIKRKLSFSMWVRRVRLRVDLNAFILKNVFNPTIDDAMMKSDLAKIGSRTYNLSLCQIVILNLVGGFLLLSLYIFNLHL